MAPFWLDGRLADDLPPRLGAGCYTTGRYQAGRVRHGERLAARLVRDAAALGLGPLDEDLCLAGLLTLGRAGFGERGEGIVRLEAGRDAHGRVRLRGDTREVGPEPDASGWRAIVARVVHPGPGTTPGLKRSGIPVLEAARREARAAAADDALLVDRDGWLVEGARTNLLVLGPDARLRTPPLGRGAVAGVARTILLESMPEIEEADVAGAELGSALALVAVNAVRGAHPIRALGDRALRAGRASELALRLARILDQVG